EAMHTLAEIAGSLRLTGEPAARNDIEVSLGIRRRVDQRALCFAGRESIDEVREEGFGNRGGPLRRSCSGKSRLDATAIRPLGKEPEDTMHHAAYYKASGRRRQGKIATRYK